MTDAPDLGTGEGSRREFLKSSAGAVLGAGLAAGSAVRQSSAAESPSSSKEIARLESEELVLQLFDTGTFAVTMKQTGCRWLPDPWQGVACRLTVETSGRRQVIDLGGSGAVDLSKDGNRVTLRLTGREGAAATTRLTLAGSVLQVAVCAVAVPRGAKLVSVEYPFRSFYLRTGEDDGYLALPSGEGCLIPTGPVKLGTTRFWSWHDLVHSAASHQVEHRPPMPFYGAQKDGAGYTAILETTNDFAFQYLINSTFQDRFDKIGRAHV